MLWGVPQPFISGKSVRLVATKVHCVPLGCVPRLWSLISRVSLGWDPFKGS